MIGFRQHVVTLVALFLALAVGIVLGGGPLSEVGTSVTPRTSPAAPVAPDVRADYADTFAASVATRAYAGGLAGHGVALLILPGSSGAVVDALTAQVEAAGGAVTGRYDVAGLLLDPGEKSLVDTLGSQLAQQAVDTEVPADATAYDRIGALLGAAVATTKPSGALLGKDSSTILESLAGAGLLASPGAAASRAPLVLVVLGTDPGLDADPMVEGLVAGLSGTATGVVVAGDASAADGALGRLRESPAAAGVTTVDGIDHGAGQATTVLALVRSLTSAGGAFGAAGADGAVPLG